MGISKGADLSLSMASFLPGIRAVVSVNGCNANLQCPLHYRGLTLQGLGLDVERIVIRQSGVLNVRSCYDDPRAPQNAACLVPIERASARFLFVIAQDDQVWDAELYARQAAEQLVANGRDAPEILLLPGAGHLLEPPYFPSCTASFHKFVGTSVEWGGDPESHSAGQERYWQRIRDFFLENLGGVGQSKL